MKDNKSAEKEFAKSLYIQYDGEGNKKYSLRDIESKLLQGGYKKVTHQTIKRWATKYDWNKLNEKIKQQSIEKASEERFTKEEQLIEAESDNLAKDFKRAEDLAKGSHDILMSAFDGTENKLVSVKDAITIYKTSTEIKFRIMDIPAPTDSNSKIIFEFGGTELSLEDFKSDDSKE